MIKANYSSPPVCSHFLRWNCVQLQSCITAHMAFTMHGQYVIDQDEALWNSIGLRKSKTMFWMTLSFEKKRSRILPVDHRKYKVHPKSCGCCRKNNTSVAIVTSSHLGDSMSTTPHFSRIEGDTVLADHPLYDTPILSSYSCWYQHWSKPFTQLVSFFSVWFNAWIEKYVETLEQHIPSRMNTVYFPYY